MRRSSKRLQKMRSLSKKKSLRKSGGSSKRLKKMRSLSKKRSFIKSGGAYPTNDTRLGPDGLTVDQRYKAAVATGDEIFRKWQLRHPYEIATREQLLNALQRQQAK